MARADDVPITRADATEARGGSHTRLEVARPGADRLLLAVAARLV